MSAAARGYAMMEAGPNAVCAGSGVSYQFVRAVR